MYDIISIGSATLDVFIKTNREIRTHKDHTDIYYRLGDKILINSIEIKTGGGGTNSAVAFSRLGLKSAFLGVVGKDLHGKLILEELKKEKVSFIGRIKEGNTGYSIVIPYLGERTILTFKGLNDSLSKEDINLNNLKSPWMYISTLLGKSEKTLKLIVSKAIKNKTKISLNLSSYLAKQGLNKLSFLLKNANILVLNKEESLVLTKTSSQEEALKKISNYTKGIVVITNGEHSIYAYHKNKTFIKKIKPVHVIDTTGAGDAFASAFTFGIIKGKSIKESLNLAHKESLSVLKHIGAKPGLLRKL